MPTVNTDFYQRALAELKSVYDEKPSDKTLRQILFYCEKLDWPESSITYLDVYLEKYGLNKQSVAMFLQYYLSNEKHSDLVSLLDRWEFYHGLDEELAQYRIKSSIKGVDKLSAIGLIREYVDQFKSKDSYEFAAMQSIEIKDSVGQMRYFQQLVNLDPGNRLAERLYVPQLIQQGYFNKAYEILTAGDEQPEGFERTLLLARALHGMDSVEQAIDLIKPYDQSESLVQLADWYREIGRYDSAINCVNAILLEDSSRNVVFLKADIQEERGWLSSSYALFNTLVSRDTTDSIASQRAQIVARKIAYLRRLREEQERMPIPELQPKKLVE